MKSVPRRPFLFFVSLIIGILLTEVMARVIFEDFTDDKKYLDRAFARLLNSGVVFDSNSGNFSRKFGFRLSPNSENTQNREEYRYTSKTNSLGFRTKGIQPKNDDEYRILLLGDSMLFGVGVEESEMASSIIEELGKPRLSIYNYSVSGYNTVQELIVAKTYLDILEPDHIILGFFIANDVIPNAIAFIDEEGNYSTSPEMAVNIQDELRKSFGVGFHSIVFRIIAFHVYIPRVRYQFSTREGVINKSYALLNEFKSLAEMRGIHLSVVILYPRDSVQGGLTEAWSNSRKVGSLIYSFCQQNSIEALNLLEYMHTSEDKERYFFQVDGHLNKAGNFVVAEAIFHDLIESHIMR